MSVSSIEGLLAALAARAGEEPAPGAAEPVIAHGLTPPVLALVAARVAAEAPARLTVVAVPDEQMARDVAADVGFFLPAEVAPERGADEDAVAPPPALRVPASEGAPYADLSSDRLSAMARMAALVRLARRGPLMPKVVVVSASALLRLTMPRAALLARTEIIAAEAEIDRDQVVARLIAAGYASAPVVEDPGTFAVRGGVLDVFTPLYRFPARVELFGDEVESIRLFEPDSQRTLRGLERLYLHPARETIVTDGDGLRARVLAAADVAHHPSRATRQLLEQIELGDEFVGIDTLTPAFHDHMEPVWSYLAGPADEPAPRWLVVDPERIAERARDELEIAEGRYQARIDDKRIGFAPAQHYASVEALTEALAAPAERIEVRTFEPAPVGAQRASASDLASYLASDPLSGTESDLVSDAGHAAAEDGAGVRFAVDDNLILRATLERTRRQNADELMQPLVDAIGRWRGADRRIAVAAGTIARARQLATLLEEYGCAAHVSEARRLDADAIAPGGPPVLLAGDVSAGFDLASDDLVVLTADDIFGRRRRTSAQQRAAAKRAKKALRGGLSDFSQIKPDDYLVHALHGIGQYKGLVKLPVARTGPAAGLEIDFLHIEYRGGQLYVPMYRLGDVQRYVGAEGHAPKLDKLGGGSWQKARRKASLQIRALAEELLKLYAQRAAESGYGFPPADAMFHEFEATFAFEETPDQQRAIDDVMADMERAQPMDRLVCGDVGYGKTEVALRACFKAVLGGKQAAFLAPTTVLVEQHYNTMVARFSGWPVEVARLSRFQSRAEQVETVKRLAAGAVDIVVGTHRVLSRDVRFKDLGLVVIDEEQRFGVAHKERLKRFRTHIDVLTLTATPIPRTLHLAMSGLRDLSIIATPPADRRAIRTFVSRVDDGVLREGIRRELGRGGQVFFVCPFIAAGARGRGPTQRAAGKRAGRGEPVREGRSRGLEDWAAHLRALVPGARVAVAHGQMSVDELERVMVQFVDGEFDILVSTTIVESGLDIARANTMFIDRADYFGLAQLYQLRGRIGRGAERAFCYLLVPPPEKLSTDARRRLETLQRFSELGAGFQIASHDLEIRGGGELLGAKQSGAIAALGFETYASMLAQAVAELGARGDMAIARPLDPELNVEVPGFIPDDYVPDTAQRLDLYKRLSDADDEDEIRALLDEIGDRYGAVPDEVQMLGDLMALKVHARALRAVSLEVTARRISLALAEDTPLGPDELRALRGRGGWRVTRDQRLAHDFSPAEVRAPTASAHERLLELVACVT